MRKFFLLLVLQISVLCCVAQFQWLNPRPSGFINTKIKFINRDTGFIVNYNGDLIRTNNRGDSWFVQQNFPSAITFDLKDSTGVVPAYNGTVYITADNGQTWTAKPTGLTSLSAWADVVSRDTIFLIGEGNFAYWNKLYRSTDRGNTWQLINNDLGVFTEVVDFVSSKVGYARKPNGLYKTADGGVTWQVVYPLSTSNNFLSVKFLNEKKGYAFRESDSLLTTNNGGLTWTGVGRIGFRIYDIFIVNENVAYATGEHGILYRTTDGGQSWTGVHTQPIADRYNLTSQYYFNESDGIVTGFRGRILKTSNGGTTWQQYSPTYVDMTTLSFGSSTTGYATTWNNVYKTTDNGETWQPLSFSVGNAATNDYARFYFNQFFNKDTGVLVSYPRPKVHRTVDGGQTWISTEFFLPYGFDYVSDLHFPNHKTGYFTIHTPSIHRLMRTSDGGVSWNEVGTFQNFRKIYFVNDSVGYATRYPSVYRTVDSGKTWTTVLTEDFGSQSESLYFINPRRGFLGSSQGYLKMTNDSGRTWKRIYPPNHFEDLLTIKFFNDSVGFFTTEYGNVYKTDDAGETWWLSNKVTFEYASMSITADSTVYIAGQYGGIRGASVAEYVVDSLKYTPGTTCNAIFSAKIRAVLSRIDSVWFEYGAAGFTQSVVGSPGAVSNGVVLSSALSPALVYGSQYQLRVKLLYNGVYTYSAPVSFTTPPTAVPMITATGNVLSSSITSGNQWYLNGAAITGAVNQQYTATAPGVYTVQSAINGCLTPLSAPFNYAVTAIVDPVLLQELAVYPNPVKGPLIIENKKLRKLVVSLYDAAGKKLLQVQSDKERIILPTNQLQQGLYVLGVEDVRNGRFVSKKVLKL